MEKYSLSDIAAVIGNNGYPAMPVFMGGGFFLRFLLKNLILTVVEKYSIIRVYIIAGENNEKNKAKTNRCI